MPTWLLYFSAVKFAEHQRCVEAKIFDEKMIVKAEHYQLRHRRGILLIGGDEMMATSRVDDRSAVTPRRSIRKPMGELKYGFFITCLTRNPPPSFAAFAA